MKPPYDKFEIERRPEPNFEMNATAWLLNNIWLMAVPPILLILACVFKEQIDSFTNSIYFHAFLSYLLSVITVFGAIFGACRTWKHFIKQ